MSTAILDVSSIVSTCKDHLTAEWADFKKSGVPKVQKVCLYSIGGPRDNPAAVLASVACGVAEWELLLKDVVDTKAPRDRPLLESEVVVGADGSIEVYPPRHKDREKHYTTAYTVTTTEAAIAAQQPARSKQKKKPVLKTPEEQFMIMVEQVANYMLDHVKKMSQPAVPSGNMKAQYLLIGSAALIRNRLNYFREIFRLQPTKTFTDTVCRANELVEVVSQTVLNYHCDIIRSSLLHDADSHDWQNERRYQEGEKLSSAVHMWIFYMQGVRNDLFRYTSPRLAESIMSSVLSDTLNILVTRYLQAEPSEFRLTQYRADVLAILAMLASLLPALSSTPMHVFTAGLHSTAVLPLHRRAQLLLAVAAVKAAPLNIVANNRKLLLTPQLSTASNSPSSLQILSTPAWLSFLNPSLYPPAVTNLAALPSNVAAYHMMLTVASGAGPNWTLIVRSLVQKDMYGARTLLGGLRDYWSGARAPQPCGGALCCPHLCSPPLTPQTVYAAVVQIVYRCVKGRGLLKSLMFPSAMQPAVWTSLDQSQVWNTQRPPWHHVLVQLAVPAVLPAVHQVVQTLPLEAPAQPAHPSQVSVRLEHHLTTWTVQLLQGVSSCAEELPLTLLSLCKDLTAALPSTVRPAGGQVICQVLVNALYGIINSRASLDTLSPSSDGITEAQWNMMVAVAERLCSLQTEAFQQPVAAMASAIQARLDNAPQEEECVPNSLSEYENCEDAAEAECEALTTVVLGSVQGQHALGVMWEFLQHNMEWVQHVLDVPPLLPFHPDLPAQTPQLVFAPQPIIYNPLYYHARIFYSRFEHMGVLSHSSDWDLALHCVPAWLSPRTVLTLISSRPELQEDADLNADVSTAAATLTPLLETLHEE